jgi:hypothetical protein
MDRFCAKDGHMRNKYLLFPLIVIILSLTFLIPRRAKGAIPIEVTNTNNSGPGSLRQAITDANNDPDADTIIFAAGTNGTPIILSGASGENGNTSGDLDIIDGGDLTIMGNGAANTIIDGGGIDRVFHICPGGGCNYAVTILGLTVQNGSSEDFGGGLRNEGGNLTIGDCTVKDNTAAFYGGGVYNENTLTIQNHTTIGGSGAGNQAMINGGGIFNATGSVTVDNSTVSDNTADNNGGGIWNNATLDVLNGSSIGVPGAGNQGIDGGGIYNYLDGTTTIDSSAVIYNTASDDGGGIYNSVGGEVTLDESAVRACTATEYGGGIYNQAKLTIRNNSAVSANIATDDGGGIYNAVGGDLTVDSSTISDNDANSNGGGIYNRATLSIVNGSTIGRAGLGNHAIEGGGIYTFGGTITLDGSTVSSNTANKGGGIYTFGGTITLEGSTVSANIATDEGGGIRNNGTLNIQNGSTIGGSGEGNQAIEGGGIFTLGETVMEESTVSANLADFGGGIYHAFGTTTVTSSRILNNTSTTNGGGIFNNYSFESATSVTGSCIVGNSVNSFFNNQPAQQIATGNWWGAATGPNTPSADTVLGNVDVSGHLTAPILGCEYYIYLPLVRR